MNKSNSLGYIVYKLGKDIKDYHKHIAVAPHSVDVFSPGFLVLNPFIHCFTVRLYSLF